MDNSIRYYKLIIILVFVSSFKNDPDNGEKFKLIKDGKVYELSLNHSTASDIFKIFGKTEIKTRIRADSTNTDNIYYYKEQNITYDNGDIKFFLNSDWTKKKSDTRKGHCFLKLIISRSNKICIDNYCIGDIRQKVNEQIGCGEYRFGIYDMARQSIDSTFLWCDSLGLILKFDAPNQSGKIFEIQREESETFGENKHKKKLTDK